MEPCDYPSRIAKRGVKVNGLSSVVTNTAPVTKAASVSYSMAIMVVTTAVGIAD